MNYEIVMLKTEHIHPHPDNPRKVLGDLSELAESIKKNGVMQNLTVIPGHQMTDNEWSELAREYKENPDEETRRQMNSRWSEEGYTAIIGHRRHAAATLAGLEEVPCKIANLSRKEQVSTMLEENMQRNDLTIIEQAQGFQMMMDLGETETTIAEKTGFSKTTIRHRLNIAKLDQKTLQDKVQDDSFQLSMKDLMALEQVEDIKVRNKILKDARDSRDLIWKAQSAAAESKKAKQIKKIIEVLTPLGVKPAPKKAADELWSSKWDTVREFPFDKEFPKQIKLKSTDPLYYVTCYRSVRVIKRAKKNHEESEYEKQQKQQERNKKLIKARLKEMDENRKTFIQNIISGKIEPLKNEHEMHEKIWNVLFAARAGLWRSSMRRFFTDKDDYKCTDEERKVAQEKVDKLSFTHSMLVVLHSAAEGIGDIYDWQVTYKAEIGKTLLSVYEVLKPYGWSFVQDDDIQLLNGTHELYTKAEQ